MKINIKRGLIIAAAVIVVACGGGGGSSDVAKVAAADTVIAASPTAVPAVVSIPFAFPGGVPDLGTTVTTTIAFTSTGTLPNFTIDAPGQGTATGSTEFGSCIFRVTNSSFPATHRLGAGRIITINRCTFILNTKGSPANGTPITRTIVWQLGGGVSVPISITLTIRADGVVVVNSVTIGSTTVNEVTGV